MFKDKSSSAIVACSDIGRARQFYAETLELEAEQGSDDVLSFRTGDTRLNVYRSAEAGTNRANAVVWAVGDELDAIVARLRERGVAFEHYDLPGLTLDGDVHVSDDGFKAAWFKDPDGNILHLNSM